ncbi:MAG: GGDEF domain-containing protein [Treponema sp.]|nr:GGDEF domain-containing protein [Candidatus Treponema equifaecale]
MAKRTLPIRTVNVFFLAVIGLLCVVLVYAVVHLAIQFQRYANISDQYAVVSRAALNLQEASDYLTDQARLFVISGEYENLENYFTETDRTKRREIAVKEIEDSKVDEISIGFLKQALSESKKLEDIEYYAMKLVIEGKKYDKDPSKKIPQEIQNVKLAAEDENLGEEYKVAKAWMILFSQDYMAQKSRISDLKSQAIAGLFQSSKLVHDESLVDLKQIFVRLMLNITGIFIFNLVFFVFIVALVIRPLYMHIKSIRNGKKLKETRTEELNILSSTYNQMFDKNEANEVLLRHKAEHDELTWLLNRAAYNQLLTALTDTPEHIALIIIDVDFFKLINDSYGHSTGDQVLQRVARTMVECFRTTDHICRIGGDEFAIIMTNCDTDDSKNVELITQKMQKLKEKLIEGKDGLPSVTLSCGIDISHAGYSRQVYEHADLALYEVKRSGRNDFAIYQCLPEEKRTASNIDTL